MGKLADTKCSHAEYFLITISVIILFYQHEENGLYTQHQIQNSHYSLFFISFLVIALWVHYLNYGILCAVNFGSEKYGLWALKTLHGVKANRHTLKMSPSAGWRFSINGIAYLYRAVRCLKRPSESVRCSRTVGLSPQCLCVSAAAKWIGIDWLSIFSWRADYPIHMKTLQLVSTELQKQGCSWLFGFIGGIDGNDNHSIPNIFQYRVDGGAASATFQ